MQGITTAGLNLATSRHDACQWTSVVHNNKSSGMQRPSLGTHLRTLSTSWNSSEKPKTAERGQKFIYVTLRIRSSSPRMFS